MTTQQGVLRTPDECFADLPDFGFEPRYTTVTHPRLGALRMHYIDEGPRDAPIALMLHGQPTWSFLYRTMIPLVAAAGFRVIAPDHIGFGRSDKPLQPTDYSIAGFVAWLRQMIETLDLRRITLVAQDWGGPIGLRVLSEIPDRFDAVLAANTLLPNCEPPPRGVADWPGPIIGAWVEAAKTAQNLPVRDIVGAVCSTRPDEAVLRAYDAPFPDPSYKVGMIEISAQIPIRAEMPGIAENRRAWSMLESFEKPFLTAFSDNDPTTKPWAGIFRERIPGAAGQPHTEIAGAGHFLQEERGEALAAVLIDLMRRQYGGGR